MLNKNWIGCLPFPVLNLMRGKLQKRDKTKQAFVSHDMFKIQTLL